jgi:hypothetical protein
VKTIEEEVEGSTRRDVGVEARGEIHLEKVSALYSDLMYVKAEVDDWEGTNRLWIRRSKQKYTF